MPNFSAIPVGSTLERVYYSVPTLYTIGEEHETFVAAVRTALAQRRETILKLRDAHPAGESYATQVANHGCTVDRRWVMSFPEGGGTDIMVERTNVSEWTEERCVRTEEYLKQVAR